ncbi:hypothetical protein HIM_12661 [Hirsutella minnesotensis 3608]|uniref:Uncharacterized protein n=1 Tax=Hirsutella minnesotensis 3608 TaxID=1043627 RepID=A0A0F7ZHT0_9HYPO|nr:hypothetical protein HIM_12661 [Hirsutella minnesotensis 3608]
MSSSPLPADAPAPHLRKPLDSQRGAGGEMSMMFFVQPDCPVRFACLDEHRVKGLNPEAMARVLLPPPAWLLATEYAPLRSDPDGSPTSVFFSLNLSIYGQPIDASEWTEEWFFMHGRVHPYALAWEVEQRDGLESDTGSTLLYTMPAIIVRDQGYQPPFASMDDFPCIPPIVSFTGLIVDSGHSLLRRDLLLGLDAAQFRCCGFVRLSTYIAPGVFVVFPIRANPWATLCKKMAERPVSQFQPDIPFTCTGKVAGLLRHDVMLYPPGSGRDNVFIVVPDSWTFLDKTAATVTPMAPLLSTPHRQQTSTVSTAFQDMRAAALSLATPGTLPLSPPPLASASPSTGPLTPPGKRCCPEPADTPTKRPCLLQKAPVPSSSPNPVSSAAQSFSIPTASSISEPDSPKRGPALTDSPLGSIVAHGFGSPARSLRIRHLSKKATEMD